MDASAKLSNYRQSPRKVRLVADLVRGKRVDRALVELAHLPKRNAPVFAKLLSSAVANARVAGLDEKNLVIKEIRVDKGAIMKRSMPRAHGRAFPIHKHTSHIMVVLGEAVAKEDKKTKKQAETKTEKVTTEKKVIKKDTSK